MRIAAFLWSYPPLRMLGGELMTSELLEALAAAGHDVSVALVGGQGEPYTRNGVAVSHRMVDVMRGDHQGLDVFVSHPEIADLAVQRARGLGAKYVAVVHNLQPRTLDGLCQHRPDLVVANSEHVAMELRKQLGMESIVIRPPTLPDRVAPPAHASLEPVFTTLVNLAPEKGADVFYELAALRPRTPFLGVLGGYGEQRVDSPLPENLTVMGQQPYMGLVYALTRVLLMPSTTETWGRVGCEALTQGVPVIAADLPGIREALGDAAVYLPLSASAADWSDALDEVLRIEAVAAERARRRGAELAQSTCEDLAAWVAAVERWR